MDFGMAPQFASSDDGSLSVLLPKKVAPRMKRLFLTHAHLDHAGPLPLIVEMYPEIEEIYMTRETRVFAHEMIWNQSIRIADMENRRRIFESTDIDRLLKRIRIVESGEEIRFEHFSAIPFSNGHIPGSVSWVFVPKNGADPMFFSGDLSFQPQELTRGAIPIPDHFSKFSIAVVESTNLMNLGYSRELEKNACFKKAAQILLQGGQILIPVFVIGRSSEIYTAFRRSALMQELLKRVGGRTYVDGSAREAFRICKEQVASFEYDEQDFVRDREHREKIIRDNKPAVVIAPSGMLLGNSASVQYANSWIGREKNAIFLVGWQAKGTRGAQLLEARRGRMFRFGDESRWLACEVLKYVFSAHCDALELAQLHERLQAEVTVLNHGDPETIEAFIRVDKSGRRFEMARTGKVVVA